MIVKKTIEIDVNPHAPLLCGDNCPFMYTDQIDKTRKGCCLFTPNMILDTLSDGETPYRSTDCHMLIGTV